MSVATFDPEHAFSISESAEAHLARQIRAHQATWLRLGVKESGCNGFMYTLDYVARPEPDDLTFERPNGVNIVIRRSELAMIQGTRIDYVTEGLNASLKFKNPNAESHCGCGESFSLRRA